MYLIYRKTTGEVVEKSGTNSMFPEGPPDAMAWGSRDRTGLVLVRFDDVRQADLVRQIQTHQVSFVDGKLTIGAPVVSTPDPEPVDPLDEIKSTLAWLVSIVTGVE